MRVFIGDIQGCADELDDLLDALNFDSAKHELHAVGDMVNRGPESLRTLRRLRELDADSVLGNHDLHLLGVAAGDRELGPLDTLEETLAAEDCQELLDWVRERPLIREWDDLVLVHAGLHPAWVDYRSVAQPLEKSIRGGMIPWVDPNLRFMTRVRACDAAGGYDGELAPWDNFYTGERIVVCGHWAMRGRVVQQKLRALDSGCVWGGELSAWIAEEDRILSVPARKRYAEFD